MTEFGIKNKKKTAAFGKTTAELGIKTAEFEINYLFFSITGTEAQNLT